MVLDGFFNWAFGPVVRGLSPLWSVVVISFVLTLLTTLVYKFFTDQKMLKSVKEEINMLRGELRKYKDDPKKVLELNKELMRRNAVMMKSGLKPMVITLVPLLLVFSWLGATFKDAGDLLWTFGWLGTYIIFSIGFSILLRKVLRVH